nr:hypothetical protein [uncultured Agathobaculum sp.]
MSTSSQNTQKAAFVNFLRACKVRGRERKRYSTRFPTVSQRKNISAAKGDGEMMATSVPGGYKYAGAADAAEILMKD